MEGASNSSSSSDHQNDHGEEVESHGLENNIQNSQEVLVLGLLESEIFKGDIRPNLCVCLCVCPLFNPGKNKKERKKN